MENVNSKGNVSASSEDDGVKKNNKSDYKPIEIKEIHKNDIIIKSEELNIDKNKIDDDTVKNNGKKNDIGNESFKPKSSINEKGGLDNESMENGGQNKTNSKSGNLNIEKPDDKFSNNDETCIAINNESNHLKDLKIEKEKLEDKSFINNINQKNKNNEIKKSDDLKNKTGQLISKPIENDIAQEKEVESNKCKSQKTEKENHVGDKFMKNDEIFEDKSNKLKKFNDFKNKGEISEENNKPNIFIKTEIDEQNDKNNLYCGENINNNGLDSNFLETNPNLKNIASKNNDTEIIKNENSIKMNSNDETHINKNIGEIPEKPENNQKLNNLINDNSIVKEDENHDKKDEYINKKEKNNLDNSINIIGENNLNSDKIIKDKYKNDIQENFESSDSSSDEYEYNEKYYYQYSSEVCGIRNLGNNCYLNSGLQILASCEELIDLLQKDEYNDLGKILTLFKKAMLSILNRKIYSPLKFINCFCKLNNDFIKGSQCCSQNFIRTIIRNINKVFIDKKYKLIYENEQYHDQVNKQYEKFIKSSKIFPESKIMSIFSGMTKSHSYGKCPNCKTKIDNYSFSYFIDQNMYLDEFHYKCKFSDVLKANIGNENILTMDCPKCNEEIDVTDETKYIKLPNILIFTLERYQGPTNKVSIKPDESLDVGPFTDKSVKVDSTIYELFAINIRFGSTANFGHEICQVKRKGKWYEINDTRGYEIKNISNFDCSYGLFYKKKKSQITEINYELNNLVKINISPSQNWFTSIWNFLTSPLYSLFSKEKNDLNYFKQGLYIISACDIFINELSRINIKDCNLITITKKTILKIIENNICDESDFVNEFLKGSKVNKQEKKNNLENFIKILIYNMNNEFLKIKYNLLDENNLKYKPGNNKEIKEYHAFVDKIFPQSSILFTFSSIVKNSNYAKCRCGKIFEGLYFEHSIYQKISLDNYNSSNFSYILNESFSDKSKKVFCDKCSKKIQLKTTKKFIKLGEVLIFTFENKNINIHPDEVIDLKNYIDDSLKNTNTAYELFAMNIIVYITDDIEQQFCKIKRFGKWYVIGNTDILKENQNYKQIICGLYYKLIK